MPIQYVCLGCREEMVLPDHKAGQLCACPRCRLKFLAPPATAGRPMAPRPGAPPVHSPARPVRLVPPPAASPPVTEEEASSEDAAPGLFGMGAAAMPRGGLFGQGEVQVGALFGGADDGAPQDDDDAEEQANDDVEPTPSSIPRDPGAGLPMVGPGRPIPGHAPGQPMMAPPGYHRPGAPPPGYGYPAPAGYPGAAGYPQQPGGAPAGYPQQPGGAPAGYPQQPGGAPAGYPQQPGGGAPAGYPQQPGGAPAGYPQQPGGAPAGYPQQPPHGYPPPGYGAPPPGYPPGYPVYPGYPPAGGYPPPYGAPGAYPGYPAYGHPAHGTPAGGVPIGAPPQAAGAPPAAGDESAPDLISMDDLYSRKAPAAAPVASGGRGCRLVCLDGLPDGTEFHLPAGKIYDIGRDKEADVKILSTSVSRRQARIDATGAHPVLIDCGSANGTQVNGEVVARHPLREGDLIKMGKVLFRFQSA